MSIREELICAEIGRRVLEYLPSLKHELTEAAHSKSEEIIREIQVSLQNYANMDSDNADFDTLEEIVRIMEKNNISCGGCHDFG